MAQHHYIIMFDDETKEWSQDITSEEVRFPNGTIWSEKDSAWFFPFQGGDIEAGVEFYRNADEYDGIVSRFVEELNKGTMDILVSIVNNPSQTDSDKLEDIKELLRLGVKA